MNLDFFIIVSVSIYWPLSLCRGIFTVLILLVLPPLSSLYFILTLSFYWLVSLCGLILLCEAIVFHYYYCFDVTFVS